MKWFGAGMMFIGLVGMEFEPWKNKYPKIFYVFLGIAFAGIPVWILLS